MIESILQELTLKDIKDDAKGDTRPHEGIPDRSKKVSVEFQGITDEGVMHFRSDAVTTEDQDYWEQEIVLLDWDEALNMEDLNYNERANLAVFGDIKAKCSDPSFLYWGYKFIATQLDYNANDPENRFPEVRNQGLEGSVCKHLYAVLTVLPFHISDVASKMREIKEERVEKLITQVLQESEVNLRQYFKDMDSWDYQSVFRKLDSLSKEFNDPDVNYPHKN